LRPCSCIKISRPVYKIYTSTKDGRKTVKERDHFEELGIDRRILKTLFLYFRSMDRFKLAQEQRLVARIWEQAVISFGFHKMGKPSWIYEGLSATETGTSLSQCYARIHGDHRFIRNKKISIKIHGVTANL